MQQLVTESHKYYSLCYTMNTICQNLTYSISVIVLSSVGFQKLFINKEHIIQSYLCIDCFLSPLLIDECKSLWCHKWMATSCPHVLQSSTTGVCANILFLFLGKKKKKNTSCAGSGLGLHRENTKKKYDREDVCVCVCQMKIYTGRAA